MIHIRTEAENKKMIHNVHKQKIYDEKIKNMLQQNLKKVKKS